MSSEKKRVVAGLSPEPPLPEPPKLHRDVLAAQTQDVFLILLVLRFCNALCLRTFFQPDEFFQALEPAWNIAFGPGSGAWLTWEWQHQLRSSLHPALFAGFYVVADNIVKFLLPPFRPLVLIWLPKIVQSVFATLGDFYTWKLADKIFGENSHASWATLWLTMLNPWQFYCSTRTFSNSLETTLTIMALYHWPWELLGDSNDKAEKLVRGTTSAQGLRLSLILAAIAVILRPTNLLIWGAILTLTVTRLTLDGRSPIDGRTLTFLVSEIVLCGACVLGLSVVSDRFYFGFWTFPPYEFLRFNISKALAVFYGRNDWHYYLSQGIPLLTTTFLPFALLGIYKATVGVPSASIQQSNTLKTLAFVVISMVGALSLISHKEVRFIYPLLPILHILAAPHAMAFFTAPASAAADTTTTQGGRDKHKAAATATPSYGRKTIRKPLLSLLLIVNLALAGYLSLFHQRAPLAVLSFLRSEYERLHPDHLDLMPRAAGGGDLLSGPHPSALSASAAEAGGAADDARREEEELFALFLMPCHSTPWRSHLVYPGLRARALTCEPPLHTEPGSPEREGYLDEADRFYLQRPWGRRFLEEEMWPRRLVAAGKGKGGGGGDEESASERGGEVPRYIVGFEGVEGMLAEYFAGEGRDLGVELRRVWEGWNGLFSEDWRRKGLMVVWDTGVRGKE